jgi:hypothetical protein
LSDIFQEDTSDNLSALNTTYSDYLASLDSGTSSDGTPDESDYDSDQLSNLVAQIQYDLDTINLSNIEKEIFDVDKQVNEWNISLTDLGYSLSDAEELTGAWSEAQKNVLRESLTSDWQGIIDQNTLSDVDLELLNLDKWYNEQLASAEALGMETDTLTEAYKVQKDAMKDSLTVDWQDIIDQNTLSDIDLELLNLDAWYNEQKAAADELGLSLDTLTEAYNLQKDSILGTQRNTIVSGIIAFNEALDDTYRVTGQAALTVAGLTSEFTGFDLLASAIDNLNAVADSTDDSVFDTVQSLVNFGGAFESLNAYLVAGEITASQYETILGELTSRYTDSISSIESTKDAYSELIDNIESTIDSILSGTKNLAINADYLFQNFQDAYVKVMSGDTDAVSDMTSFATSYLDAFTKTTTSKVEYDRQQGLVLRSLKEAEGSIEGQVDVIDELLDLAKDQVVDISDIADLTNEELAKLYSIDSSMTDMLTWMDEDAAQEASMFGALFDTYLGGNSTLAQLLSNLRPVSLPGGGSAPAGATGRDAGIDYVSGALLGNTVSELETLRQALASGNQELIEEFQKADTDWTKFGLPEDFAPKMASGGIVSGPLSGYPATLHGTEAVIPLDGGSVPVQMNNEQLLTEVKNLRAEVKNLRAGIFQIAKNTKDTVDYFDNVTEGENSIQTRTAS